MEHKLDEIFNAVVNGDADAAKLNVQSALMDGMDAERILNEGLIASMKEVGRLFEEGEYFVPEMLISARAMQGGMSILRPVLVEQDIQPIGKVVIGTVKGDLHDIGKNLVSMMLEGAGFQVYDLKTDVAPEKFLEAVQTYQPDILGMSALLTTTMNNMKATIRLLEEKGARENIKIIVGGAPLTQAFAEQFGADGFAQDASQAAALAKALMDGSRG